MDGNVTPSRKGPITGARKNHRNVVAVDEDSGDPIECTGKSCKSCTGGVVADCVALCCCPCAVIDILALAFVKIPWKMGRKLILKRKKKMSCNTTRKLEKKKKEDDEVVSAAEKEKSLGIVNSRFGEDELKDKDSGKFDAEEVWLELYEIGHLSFGRVSFTGINPSQGKAN